MKKILFALVLLGGFAFTASAQYTPLKGSSHNLAKDTITNTATVYLTTPSLVNQNSGKYVIGLLVTNKTGTSTITGILQSSLDNVNWENHFKTPGQTGINCDTLAISGSTYHMWNILPDARATYQNIQFTSNSGRRLYFRIKMIGGATQSTEISATEIPQ